jgi:hypothetical protein
MESGLKVLSVKKIASRPSRPQAKFVSELDDAGLRYSGGLYAA